jgi:penicillin-binding protein 1C
MKRMIHAGQRQVRGIVLLLAMVLLSSCSVGLPKLPALPVLPELPEIPEIPPEVVELSSNLDDYLIEYRTRYALAPRPAPDPLGAVEAYLQRYQPGPLPRVFQTTTILDRNGLKLAEIVDEGYRTWVSLDQISPHIRDAVIATEDATFYSNPGYDARRVVGAMMQNAEAGTVVSGASTITMQLARQLFFTPEERYEQSMERKAFEALLAQELTLLFTKDEILEMYLNLVHFGQQVYGVEAAANLYFGKSARDLTLAEATLLAGIPQAPGRYDLFADLDAVKRRQGVVLALMVRHGFLTKPQADFVFWRTVKLNPDAGRPPVRAPHFVNYVTTLVNQRLDGYDVRRSGMRVFTTLDLRMQEIAQRVVSEQVTALQPRYDLSNAALVALRPGTAEILAMVGSADFANPSIAGQVNVNVRQRQPGSAIKPVLYAIALDDGLISPATLMWDVPVRYKLTGAEEYSPRNYDETFHGPVTARMALANSYNIPAVKLLEAVGIDRMLEGARAMGLTSLNRDTTWYGLSLTLGGGEVTPLDLTTAFHTLANQGAYVPPQAILFSMGAPEGRNMNMSRVKPVQVIEPASAYLVTSMLSDNDARAAEFGPNSMLKLSRPNAAKTGTTSDFRDNWTQGYTRYLVAGVWAGNSDGRPMRNVSGVTGAAPIWNAFMEAVLADPEMLELLAAPEDAAAWEFPVPEGVTEVATVCPNGIQCKETEIFADRWIEQMGSLGPLGDSVITATMRTVYVDRGSGQQAIGACSAADGTRRELVRMPFGLTRTLPVVDPELVAQTDAPLSQVNTLGAALDLDIDADQLERIRREQREALTWGSRNGTSLYLGPCDQADAAARFMYGNAVRSVAVSGYTDSVTAEPEAEQERRAEADFVATSAAPPPPAAGSTAYSVLGVAHDANCGGNYVLGQVVNASGQAVAGVAVTYSDQFGNVVNGSTSGAAQGYGSFRFPVLAPDLPHTIYISVAGATSTASVPHLQGGATDQGCHYVVWRGAD